MDTIWYLLLTFLLLSIMIVIHELGHFLFAKLFGVTVLEFSIGMGPAIFTTKKKEKKPKKSVSALGETFYSDSDTENYGTDDKKSTEPIEAEKSEDQPTEKQKTIFSIRAFPIGGYVKMSGEDEASEDKNAFCNKAVWKRFLVTVAGPAMNILLGFLCMCALVGIECVKYGDLSSNVVDNFAINAVSNNSEYSEDPLQEGDRIVKVGGVYVFTGNELVYEIMNSGRVSEDRTVVLEDGTEAVVKITHIDLVVERDGETVLLENVAFPADVSSGATYGDRDFNIKREEVSLVNIVKHAVFRSVSTVKVVFDSIKDLLTGRYGAEAVSGPVGMAGAVGDAAKTGFYSLLYLFTLITMNLGVFNLLPLPALDGGRIIFLGIEAIFRKPIKKEVEGMINTTGLLLLLAVMLFVTLKDIANLF